MSPAAGARIGPYEILSPAGAGGMGEVWKARDTRLGRTVAIKISDKRFSDRFEREARAIAALNHPHICAIYDVGPDYLVMEYIEGEPVKGPLPLAKALEYAKQILEALHAAHRAGIVHRDLKPANILVGKSGVKVLDFGLAKMQAVGAIAGDGLTELSNAITREGTIAGTLQYMAPEQLQAKEVDSRADIFAFGCVLYEMLTGKRAFDGGSAASIIAAILERPAPSVASIAPPALDRVLKRCLAKDPEERWQSALDVSAQLGWVASEPEAPPRSRRRALWPMAAAIALLTAALGALAFAHFREAPAAAQPVRFSIAPPEGGSFASVFGPYGGPPAFSPDGRRIAFAAIDDKGVRRIWVRPLDAFEAYPLVGTENGLAPFWSPDSKSIGFFADEKLKRIDVAGGPAIALADAPLGRGGTWNQEGVIVFAPNARMGLERISAWGGSPVSATTAQASESDRWPSFLPDGKHFVYVDTILASGRGTLRLGSLDARDTQPLAEADSNGIWSQGYLLFMRGGMLMAQPFDLKRLALSGDARMIAEGVRRDSTGMTGAFCASANGLLAYEGGFSNLRLTWFDRKGNPQGSFGESAQFTGVELSPDGRKAAVTENGAGMPHVWIYDTVRGPRSRFALGLPNENYPVWAHDGQTIVFSSGRTAGRNLYRKPAEGPGRAQLIYSDNLLKNASSITRDGKYLLYWTASDPEMGIDLWVLPDPLGTPGKPFPFVQTRYVEDFGRFSPDGRWVAYMSDISGQFEVYVAPFPGPGKSVPVSIAGGMFPRWRTDGKELFYVSLDNQLMAASIHVTPDGGFESGKAEPLFRLMGKGSSLYDVSPDGQRILAVAPQGNQKSETLSVVQNWTAALKK